MDIALKALLAYTILNAAILIYDLGFNIFSSMSLL